MFGLLSTNAKYNKIVKPFIALAPVSTVAHVTSPLKYGVKWPSPVMWYLRRGGAFVANRIVQTLISFGCSSGLAGVCKNAIFMLTGFNEEQMDTERIPVYMSHTPAGTSAWNLLHFMQGIKSQKFAKFDMGSSRDNLARYGTMEPPEYPLEKITNPYIALFSSLNDWMASPQDVMLLKTRLRVPLVDDYTLPPVKWNHMDFLWGKDQHQWINKRVIELLARYVD